jgi:hypothetical protein
MATASIEYLPETFVDISCSWTGFKAGLVEVGILILLKQDVRRLVLYFLYSDQSVPDLVL